MPPESSRTAEEKKQDHIDAIKERITEDIGPVIEESIQRSVEEYAATRVAPNGNDESQAERQQATEKFRSLIPRPTFDGQWTERDEQGLTQEAERDAEFQHRCTYQDCINGTWKTAYKFMGCLATDIVGPKSYLVFHDDHATSKTRFWATRFCRKLSNLIVQPVFAANPEKLALAIQWTVICRTGDRRKWRLSGCNDEDEFLRILGEVIEQSQDGTESPQTLRLMALRLFKRKYPTRGGGSPLWCQFLQRIEEKAPENTYLAEQGRDSQDFGDFEFYRVNTTDLGNLLDAIREVRVCGFPMFHDPTTVAMTVLYTRDPFDLPLRSQVMEATRAVLLSHRREAKRAQKLSMLDARGSMAPSQSGGAQDGVDEERDLGHPSGAGLNPPGEHLDDAVAKADIASEDAEEMDNRNEQAGIQEMNDNTQDAARGAATGGVSSSGGEAKNAGKNGRSEDVRPTPPSPAMAAPGRPRLEQPDTAASVPDHRDEGNADQQRQITACKPQRIEAQQVVRTGQQVLGKRPRESNNAIPSGREMMPFFRPGEYTFGRNASGANTGMEPTDPRADGSNMVVKTPFGSGVTSQSKPLTERGSNLMNRLLEGAALGSSTHRVQGTLMAAEDIGISDNLQRLGMSSIGQPAEALPLHILQGYQQNQNLSQGQGQGQPQLLGQNQTQNGPEPQNQIQGSVQPGLCALCDSSSHRTGQCPIPSSVHHGDTAVCGPHNSSNRHPLRGHIFDCSRTKPQSTCRLVNGAQAGIWCGDDREEEYWEFLIKWLVVERQHKAPIRVEDDTLDFVNLVIEYAWQYYDGEMPPQVNFRWPYTKAEARRYESILKRYDELGPDQMPVGMLDGKSLAEIKAMRDRGEIPMQVYNPNDRPATNPEPARPATSVRR